MRFKSQIVALPLVVCLLVVPALAAPATIAHETQHAHHKATTHASALCSWFCGAGQVLNHFNSDFVHVISLLTVVDIESTGWVDAVAVILLPSRGPPSLLSLIA